MTDPIHALWASEGGDARPPAPADLRRRARQLVRRTWLRDSLEYAAALVVVIVFASYWRAAPNMVVATGCALVIVGTLMVVVGLWRRRARPAADATAEAGVAYLRGQLVQQRDMLASVPRWYLAPLVPGMLVFLAGAWSERIDKGSPVQTALLAMLTFGFVATVFAGVWWLNRRGARQLDAEIAALDNATADR